MAAWNPGEKTVAKHTARFQKPRASSSKFSGPVRCSAAYPGSVIWNVGLREYRGREGILGNNAQRVLLTGSCSCFQRANGKWGKRLGQGKRPGEDPSVWNSEALHREAAASSSSLVYLRVPWHSLFYWFCSCSQKSKSLYARNINA